MTNEKICPSCQKPNQLDAGICVHCGKPLVGLLPSRTEPVPDQPIKLQPPEHILQLTRLYADIIALLVLGQEQPILVKGGGKVILGRFSPGEAAPSVDFTPYHAGMLGVSRHHAMITRQEGQFMLQDLGSTNGTWLNDTKLAPQQTHELRSSDIIRLGQLGVVVYYDTPRSSTATLVLKWNAPLSKDGSLPLPNIAADLLPYLSALAEAQKIFDDLLNRTASELGLSLISLEMPAAQVVLKITSASEAARLLKNSIAPWKKERATQVMAVVKAEGGSDLKPPQTESALNGRDETTLPLALSIVHDLAPDRTQADLKAFAEKLAPSLRSLVSSSLEIVADNSS